MDLTILAVVLLLILVFPQEIKQLRNIVKVKKKRGLEKKGNRKKLKYGATDIIKISYNFHVYAIFFR